MTPRNMIIIKLNKCNQLDGEDNSEKLLCSLRRYALIDLWSDLFDKDFPEKSIWRMGLRVNGKMAARGHASNLVYFQ